MDLVVIALTMNINKKHVCLFLIPDFPMTWKKRYKKRLWNKGHRFVLFFLERKFSPRCYIKRNLMGGDEKKKKILRLVSD